MATRSETSAGYPELFTLGEEPLPQALDDELLYSWSARFHRLSGNSRPGITSRMLFGHSTIGLRHDFPGQLDHFEQATRGRMGTTLEVIKQRTQFALYAPFLEVPARQMIAEAMRGQDKGLVSRYLGLTRSGRASETPLKACPACVEEDRRLISTGWWRMNHQWPTTYICLRHRCQLRVMATHPQANRLNDWYLPSDLRGEQWEITPVLGQMQVDRLARIAQWTEALLQRQESYLDAALLRHTYLFQANIRGWLAMDGSLRFAALRTEFANAHRGLEALPRWKFLNDVSAVNGGFLGFLLRNYRGRRHPLKHVLLMTFLFEDPTEFNAQYENSRSIAEAEGADALSRRLTDKRVRLIQMVESEGKSVNAACRELGIQTAQGIRQLNKESVAYRRRPRILTHEVRQALEELLRAGVDRGEITRQLGIRKGFIKDYLAGKPELRAAWEQATAAERVARYRAHFLRILEDNPDVPIKRIRRIRGNSFEWLYRNDRAWLAENLPSIWRRSESSN